MVLPNILEDQILQISFFKMSCFVLHNIYIVGIDEESWRITSYTIGKNKKEKKHSLSNDGLVSLQLFYHIID